MSNNELDLINFSLENGLESSTSNHQDPIISQNTNMMSVDNFEIMQNCTNVTKNDDPFDIYDNIIKTSNNLCTLEDENTIKNGYITENILKSKFCNNFDSFLDDNISLISFESKPISIISECNQSFCTNNNLEDTKLNLIKTNNDPQEQNLKSTCTDLIDLDQSPIKSQKDDNISSQMNCIKNSNPLNFTVFESSKIFDESYEDIMSIQPTWIDSGSSDIDSDLEMLKIPILEQLDIKDSSPIISSNDDENRCEEKKDKKCVFNRLEILKKKVEFEKQNNDKKDVATLISDLKEIILECSNEEKKKTANDLLESLESLLNDKENFPQNKSNNDGDVDDDKKCDKDAKKSNEFIIPKIIVKQDTNEKNEIREENENQKSNIVMRQETFDVDEKNKSVENENVNEDVEKSDTDQNDPSTNIVIMKGPAQNIVEQIDKILKEQDILVNSNESNSNLNPTYVFVVSGTPKTLMRQGTEIYDRKNKSEENDNDDDENKSTYRRRSLSLTDVAKNKNSQNLDNFKTPKRPVSAYSTNGDQKTIKTTPIMKNLENNRKKLLHTEDNTGTKLSNRRSLNIFSNNSNNNNNNNMNDPKKNASNNKLRVKSNELYGTKQSGPIKATVPIIKVAPILVDQKSGFGSGSSTSEMNTQIQQPITSTPILSNNLEKQKRISLNTQNNTRIKRKSFSPIKNSRTRYSYNPVTTSKLSGTNPSIDNKRKSFAETATKLTPSKMGTQTLKQGNKENSPISKKK